MTNAPPPKEPTTQKSVAPATAVRPGFVAYLLLGALLAAGFVVWNQHRYEFDDAYISYRYATNLAAGNGLVFNPGEQVEGYSNFLWVVVLAGGAAIGLDPPAIGPWLGLMSYFSMIALCWTAIWTPLFKLQLTGVSRIIGSAALALLVTTHGLAESAGSGLETHFFALLILVGGLALATTNLQTLPSLTRLGIVPVLLFLTRPDGIVPGVVLLSVVVARSARERSSLAIGLFSGAIAAAPALAVGVCYSAFKFAYFGSLLPNPYYAKGADSLHMAAGLAYLKGFLQSYPFFAIAFVLIVATLFRTPRNEAVYRAVLYAALTAVAYFGFVVKVGGDFMEYRLGLHCLPTVVFAAVIAIPILSRRWWVQLVAMAILVGLSFRSPILETRYYMQSLEEMNRYTAAGRRVGRALGQLPPEISVATTLIGTIGYYSGLRIFDQWGLVDPGVRHRAQRAKFYRGHVRFAGHDESRRRGTHLYLDHPHLCRCSPNCLRESRQVLIYTEGGECARALVLIPDPALLETLCGDPLRYPFTGAGICPP